MDTHASATNLPDSAEAGAHVPHEEEEHAHPTWSTYWKVALILTLITVAEVWAYYIPSFVAGRGFVPTLLILSALKFTIVVMFYMHLKYDHRLFRVLFTGPLLIASLTLLALLHPVVNLTSWRWSIHPSTVIGIAALGAIYVWAAHRLEREPTRSQRIYFFSGLLVMFASLNGPLHDLSDDYLFSAHMVQHLLLTLAMPPLLLAGVPGWMLRPVLARKGIAPVARFFTRAPIAFVAFNLVLAVWHLPPFYNAAMANHNIHIVEHLMFMVAAVLMWWPLMSQIPELPRLAYPGQMLYSFLMSIPMSIIAVYIAMSDHVLYPAYAAAPRVLSLSPLEDQLLGALIMWIPGGIIFYIIMTVVFFKWNARGEDSTAGAQVDWKPSTA